MTKVFGGSLTGAVALTFCSMLVAGCGDDGGVPGFPDGAVNDATVNDASSVVDATPAADGPQNLAGPVVMVLSPTDPGASLDSDAIVTGSRFTVRCQVERNTDPVDSTSIVVTATSGGVAHESAAAPTSVPDVYQGDIVVTDFANGAMNVRCTASDTEARTNSASVDTLLDQGPSVQVLSPLAGSSYASQVPVSIAVASAPVTASDPGGVADFDNVQISLGGQDITSLLTHDGNGGFTGNVQFADPLFVPTLDGQQTLVVQAPNVRTTVATERQIATVFTADELGPSIVVTEPLPGQLVSGIVTFKVTVTDTASVSPLSVIGTVAGVHEFTLTSTTGADFEGSFDTRQLGVGMIFPNVVIRAQDLVGNQSSTGFVLALDNQSPLASLDPPLMRESTLSELNSNFECGELFDPLGPEAADDGEVVPQLFRINVRAEDRGNTALANPGTLVPHADIDGNKVSLFVLDDSSRALIVDTDGDGVCDSINPLLTPTSVPTAANEAAVINMNILTEIGASFLRAPPLAQPEFRRPSYFPSFPEGPLCAPPPIGASEPIIVPVACELQSSATRIIELEGSSKAAIWGIPPIDEVQCFGNAFDALATNISDGWACLAMQVEDNLGNLGISPPLRLCIDHDGDNRDASGASLYAAHGCGQSRNIKPGDVGDVTIGAAAASITAGGSHTCAITSGNVRCWGEGGSGQLGYGNTNDIGDDETPESAGTVLSGMARVSAGDEHTCAVSNAGVVSCWGNGASGRLGSVGVANIGDTGLVTGSVDLGGATANNVSAGGQHTCARAGTSVYCWGEASDGQLGYGDVVDIGDTETPGSAGAVDVGFDVAQVVAGGTHTCALSDTGTVRCWGANSAGQLGQSNTTAVGDNEAPSSVGVVNVTNNMVDVVVELAAGDTHTCARLSTGKVRCWGNGTDGRLGYGNELNVGDDEEPWIVGDLEISLNPIVSIVAGRNHTCAVDSMDLVYCWGIGFDDELGHGRSYRVGHRGAPAAGRYLKFGTVEMPDGAQQVAPGGRHTCVLLQGGGVRCWGANNSGQVGHADKGDSLSHIGDVAPVWMRPNCTGTYNAATNTTDSSTPCTLPESFQDNPAWQLRRSDVD